MVRDHQKIQRTRQFDRHAGRRDHLLAAGEAVGVLGTKAVCGHESIAGIRGVVVCVSKIDVGGIFAICVR